MSNKGVHVIPVHGSERDPLATEELDQLVEAYLTNKEKAPDEMVSFLVKKAQEIHGQRLQTADQIRQIQSRLEGLSREHTGLVAQERGYITDIRKWLDESNKSKGKKEKAEFVVQPEKSKT